MRGNDHIVIMNVQVMNGDRGEIQLERLPVRAIVQGKVHPGLGSGKQQALALRVFADGPDIRTFGDAIGDQGPALAIIARAVDEWAKIVELVAVHRKVGGARVMVRGFDDADHAPLGQVFGRDVGPTLAAIQGEMHKAVVRPGPEHVFLQGRLGEGENGAVILDAGDIERDRPAGGLLLGFIVAGQVAADGRPALTAVGGLEHHLRCGVERVRIMRRDE